MLIANRSFARAYLRAFILAFSRLAGLDALQLSFIKWPFAWHAFGRIHGIIPQLVYIALLKVSMTMTYF